MAEAKKVGGGGYPQPQPKGYQPKLPHNRPAGGMPPLKPNGSK
jgi:hypothetical protein